MKTVKLTESDITRLVTRVLSEQEVENANYMFFSNLKQMKRQIEMIMEMDPNMIDDIIQNGINETHWKRVDNHPTFVDRIIEIINPS